ncbi:integral membrane sensor signal transduction histidine kinase [Colwellia psychrerythraea]|uniref:histidine kinase n=2 Tax=Colwellia psychrerythraea TaxID=28229 RepID=A0A099K999_COLPS|nr:integral membrane sensor signal transduction histidine kinase [Colwellia psychrerythraea]
MKIFTKLILTLLFISLLLLSLIYIAVQWSFDRGMLDYINKKELASLQLLSNNLATFYQQEQRWTSLVESTHESRRPPHKRPNRLSPPPFPAKSVQFRPSQTWHQLLKFSHDGITLPTDAEQYLANHGDFIRNHDRPPYRKKRPLRSRTEEHQPRPAQNQNTLHPSLLDAEKKLILGRLTADFSLQAINLNGELIGYLALPPKTQLTDEFDLAFLAQIKANLLYIVLGLFLIIVIIAVPLSRHFVTPIKRLEHAMRALNNGDFNVKTDVVGKDELASLSLHFNDLAKTLEQNESSRNTWLANISHELRTPIAIIKGEIEAIEDGIRPLDLKSLSSLNDEVNHLHKLVNDLSTLSNAEIGAMRYQKDQLNLADIIEHNLLRHHQHANDTSIIINQQITKGDVIIWADETRVNQLIDNLINNSLKYTQAPGTIYLSLSKEASYAILTICDSAPSVPDNSLPKLFDHLYRVESSRNRKTGGSGLGLALCKKIMSAHQGTITASHAKYGGLEVTCTFPLIT